LYLSILFNLFLRYGYVPDAFSRATIIPLVKCKTGDLSDVNNYRAIALSNSVTKILESLLYCFIESHVAAYEYQSGFKKNHSSALCTHVLKETVNYYRQMVAMFLFVSLTLIRHLIMLTTGYYSVN